MSAVLFRLRYLGANLRLTLQLLVRGQWRRLFAALHARLYQQSASLGFRLRASKLRARRPPPVGTVQVITDHPLAFTSPDHIAPLGTKYDNSTNRRFVLKLDRLVQTRRNGGNPAFLDLGCSGGQLVKDFHDLHWIAIGLEGSDYSLKRGRANWRTLANQRLFTCDITQPFSIIWNRQPLQFDLITAWEVMEHIHANDLDRVFANIRKHLTPGGYFVASTDSGPSVVNGLDLHQTKMSNAAWRDLVAHRYPDLQPVDLGLKTCEYVRYNFGEPSFLLYQKSAEA